jgi:hypothetical protein
MNKFNVTINEEAETSTFQNITFADQNPQWEYKVDSDLDPTFMTADTQDATLDNFFSRPVKVASYSWGTGTNLFQTFNPWQLYFENPRVINRITNFNLLRCKLKVRILLNGNGFHYGRAIASYRPLHSYDQLTRERAFYIQDVVAASQRPHVYLDPTKSQGGTIECPFFWYKNALDIPDEDWRHMGEITIHGMQTLKHANGATDRVTVSVFVWAEEVSLSIPTANEPGALTPQGGELEPHYYEFVDPTMDDQADLLRHDSSDCDEEDFETCRSSFAKIMKCLARHLNPARIFTSQAGEMQAPDEYGTGIISRPANMVAKAAGALANAPVIGSYARATEIAASTVGTVARMFGYSRPPVMDDIQPYRPTLVGNLANTNMPDSVNKLTLDAKQELTIDPRTMGLGSADEMSICSVAKRESYLTTFGWDVDDSAETLLWNTEVNPVLWNTLTVGGQTEIHMPACCFATLPFTEWRGTMKFRFQIVASAFHKGRLKIVYDPSYPLTNEYNTNYMYIVDLAKERDFTVDVNWGQQDPYIEHRIPGRDSIPHGTSQIDNDPKNFANGVLSVYVVNELTVPNSIANNDIQVNVFISAGDNFEVINPTDTGIKNLTWASYPYFPQAGELEDQAGELGEAPDADKTENENAPMKPDEAVNLSAAVTKQDHTTSVFFGDPVTSFRQILKRYCYWAFIPDPVPTGPSIVRTSNFDYPLHRGAMIDAPTADQTNLPWRYSHMVLLNYLTPAYMGCRGGIRWKYHRVGFRDKPHGMMYTVRNADGLDFSPGGPASSDLIPIDESSLSTVAHAFQMDGVGNSWPGSAATEVSLNPVLEVEYPFQDNSRFWVAKKRDALYDVLLFEHPQTHGVFSMVNENNYGGMMAHVAAGEDYMLSFFVGAPVAFYVENPAPSLTIP